MRYTVGKQETTAIKGRKAFTGYKEKKDLMADNKALEQVAQRLWNLHFSVFKTQMEKVLSNLM